MSNGLRTLVFAGAAALLLGCGGDEPPAGTPATAGQPTAPEIGGVREESQLGANPSGQRNVNLESDRVGELSALFAAAPEFEAAAAPPAGFPESLPGVGSFRVVGSYDGDGVSGVAFESDDEVEIAADALNALYEASGWVMSPRAMDGDTRILLGESNGWAVHARVAPAESGTRIEVTAKPLN